MRIELKCRECGGNRFNLDQADDDEAHVECDDCGHEIGTVGQLKRQVAEEVLKHAKIRQRST